MKKISLTLTPNAIASFFMVDVVITAFGSVSIFPIVTRETPDIFDSFSFERFLASLISFSLFICSPPFWFPVNHPVWLTGGFRL
jgi:hypothetical protein